nr:ribonuclease H-like domain-containing protein [Tanacetum cinerariifolium]
MTENMSYLTDYEEIDEGYIALGGNPKGGKITGKGIENLVDHKVKVIRCDNGTEFKNMEMNQFCEMNDVVGNQYNGNAITKACDDADQENEENVNNTNNVIAAGTNGVSAVRANTKNKLPFDPEMPELEDINTFNFSNEVEDDGVEANMKNLYTGIQVSPTPTTRIHKDHHLDQAIGDLHSTIQTSNMSKNL